MYLESELARNQTPVRRKFIASAPGGGARVYVEHKERPFSRLDGTDLLDTGDLCRLYRVAARTIYRWMAEHRLEPFTKVGREWLFTKDAIVNWHEDYRPVPGRPSRR